MSSWHDGNYGNRALEILRQGDVVAYLALLMRVARVGEVCIEERDLAIPIARALEADDEQTAHALQWADDASRTMDELAASVKEPVARLCLYRDACRMSLADGRLDTDEQTVLDELARVLELDSSVARRVAVLTRRVWEAQEEFLQMLP